MLSFSHRRKISLPPLSLSGYNTQFFFPPHFLSRTLVADRRACTRVRFSNRWGEDKRDRGWERGLRERERERERSWFVKFAHLFVYRHTIELKLGRVRMNAWTPAAYVRRYAWTSSLIHNPSKGLMELRGSYTARTISIPLSLFLSLSFSVFTFLVFFFSFFKPRSAPLLFSRMRREGLIPRSSETLHLSRGIVQFLTILRVFRRRCRYNLKGGREKLRMDGESNNLHFQCKDDAAG